MGKWMSRRILSSALAFSRLAAVLAIGVATVLPSAAQTQTSTQAPPVTPPVETQQSAIQNLAGRWTGNGTIESSGGGREKISCVVTYFIREGGKRFESNLRPDPCGIAHRDPDYRSTYLSHPK